MPIEKAFEFVLPKGFSEGVVSISTGINTVALAIVKNGAVACRIDISDATACHVAVGLLKSANGAAPPQEGSAVGTSIPTVELPITKIALSPSQLVGHEQLQLRVGAIGLGVNIEHSVMGQLGQALVAASADTKSKN